MALFAAEFVGIYWGLAHTNASRLTVFLYSSVFVVAILLPRFVPTERLGRKQWAGLVIAFGAVTLAFSEGLLDTDTGHWRGDLLAICAAIFWALVKHNILFTAERAAVVGVHDGDDDARPPAMHTYAKHLELKKKGYGHSKPKKK